MTADIFKEELEGMLTSARENGLDCLEVKAGNLHRRVGGYPSGKQQMRLCCQVMFQEMTERDEVYYAPTIGMGATMRVKYYL